MPMHHDAERDALKTTDERWAAAASAGRDVDAIVAQWTDDAKVYPPGMPVIEGKAAIRQFVADSLQVPGFSITWTPEHVTVSADGTMGYCTGSNRMTAPGPDGNVATMIGRYVTVWRKEADGVWRCAVDIWNAGPS